MDKNIHNEIDDLFHDAIEPLNEPPAQQVWENIEQQLNNDDAEKYKRKFIIFRRMATVLLLLLLSFTTFTLMYINTIKNHKSSGYSEVVRNKIDAYNKSGKKNNLSTKKSKPVNTLLLKDNKANANFADDELADNNTGKTNYNRNKNKIEEKAKKISFNNAEKPTVQITNEYANENGKIKKETTLFSRQLKPAIFVHWQVSDTNFEIANLKFFSQQLPEINPNNLLTGLTADKSAKKANKKNNRFFPCLTVTAFAAPEFAGYSLKNNVVNQYDNKPEIDKREKSEVSFSTGILIGYNISKKLSLQSGIIYSSSHISIDPTKIYAVKVNTGDIKYQYVSSAGFSYILPPFNQSPNIGDSIYTRASKHTLHYKSIPLIIKYRVDHKKLSFNPGIGIAFNFLTKAILETNINDGLNTETESITQLEGLRKISYSLMFTPELQYRLSKKWSISAIPYFKYVFTSINKKNIVKTYPYNVGLGAGAVYKF